MRCLTSFLLLAMLVCQPLDPAWGKSATELRFCLHSEPKTFNPLLVDDEASETIRYLTGGVLIRVNRRTQALEPELAVSWKVSESGAAITFDLREGLSFSDGTPFSAEDVGYTIQKLMDPNLHSPTGDSFRSSDGPVKTKLLGPYRIAVIFPAAVAGLERLFDQVAIVSAHVPEKNDAVLGPFYVAEHQPGSYILLKRNTRYWKHDKQGRQLPYLDSVRLDIQQNRDMEMLRFRRGEIHLINRIDEGESFNRLVAEMPSAAHDAGPSLDSEQMWFNQAPGSSIPAYKKTWFASVNFRRAVSAAINRDDLSRVVFEGRARPAIGPVSPADRFWFNQALKPPPFDPQDALRRLAADAFRLSNGVLRDREGHAVEFSLVTNAGNKTREKMAAMIQQDLAAIGIKLNIVILDFPSLLERISRTFDYEACLLGMVNVDPDPNAQMSVWLSSASNHQWNPNEKSPATPWEAEIDRLMRAQASTRNDRERKENFDKVQQIAWDEAPFIYLVNKDALSAVSPAVKGAFPVALRPQTFWNIDVLDLAEVTSKR